MKHELSSNRVLTSRLAVAVACLFTLSTTGCVSKQVRRDGVGLRQALVDLYTDQAIDNLIRARNRELFVQMKYSALSVDDSSALSVTANGESGTFTTALQQLTRTVTTAGAFPFVGSAGTKRVLSYQADPVTDQNYVYEEYVAFADNPFLLVTSNCKPTCPYVVARQCGNVWYYVPAEAGSAFLQLVIDVSVGLDSKPSDAWTATIVTATPYYDQYGNADPTNTKFVLTLDTPVPNDEGRILANLASVKARKLALHAYPEYLAPFLPESGPQPIQQQPKVGLQSGALTTTLYAVYEAPEGKDPAHPSDQHHLPPLTAGDLRGATISYLSKNYPKTTPASATDLQKIEDTLDTIRIQTSRNGFTTSN